VADTQGPVSVLTAVTIDAAPGLKTDSKAEGEAGKKPEGRLVVLGSSTFASNQGLGFQGNRDLFLNIVAWLAGQEGEIAIRPKDTRQNPIFLTANQGLIVLLLSLGVLPGAVMVCGIWRVIRRRRIK
jgi:ABC-type uncharacterized transport system involved in gliding motility auxiliary subunit